MSRRKPSKLGTAGALAVVVVAVLALFLLWGNDRPTEERSSEPGHAETSALSSAPEGTVGDELSVAAAVEPTPSPEEPPAYWLFARAWTRDGEPVSGAEIACEPRIPAGEEGSGAAPPVYRAVSDENGAWAQEFPERGNFSARCTWRDMVALESFSFRDDDVVFVDFILRPAAVLEGRTVDGLGKTVADVALTCYTLWGIELAETRSDPQGVFRFDDLVPDSYLVKGDAPGYAPAVSDPAPTGQELRLVMTAGGQLIATILERGGRNPVKGMQLSLDGIQRTVPTRPGVSDTTGSAIFEGLTPGQYELKSVDESYALSPVRRRVSVVAGQATRLEILAEATASIAGRVVDAETREGIANVGVSASVGHSQFGGAATTDTTGAFVVKGLAPGAYNLSMGAAPRKYKGFGFNPMVNDLRLGAGEERTGILLELRGGLTLRGQVVYDDGRAAPGATVKGRVHKTPASYEYVNADGDTPAIYLWNSTVKADGEGHFNFLNVPDGKEVYFSANLHAAESQEAGPFLVGPTGAENVVLTLKETATGSIGGQVVDTQGRPMKALVGLKSIDLDGAVKVPPAASTDGEGYFLLVDVLAGTYQVNLGRSSGGYINSEGPVTVQAGQAIKNLRLVLNTDGLHIVGIVYDGNGSVVPHYMIEAERLQDDDGFEHYATVDTGTDGRFILENVEQGAYRLHGGETPEDRWRMEVRAGDEVEIVLP